ncbi:MAG: hypothetical protein JJV98_18895, partial [Desulfosarcina sp.]|nr:hypothetical protein [Desulfobacterales bacterium]
YKKLWAAVIVMGCAIAYLVSHAEIVPIQVLTGAMGVAVAAIGGLLSLHRFPPRNQVRPQPIPELVVATVSAGRQPVRGISKVTRSN